MFPIIDSKRSRDSTVNLISDAGRMPMTLQVFRKTNLTNLAVKLGQLHSVTLDDVSRGEYHSNGDPVVVFLRWRWRSYLWWHRLLC